METIADRVRLLLELSGLSGAQLGRVAGLSRATVPSIERGDNKEPEAKTLLALAKATGCDAGWLLSGKGAPPSAKKVKAAVSGEAA